MMPETAQLDELPEYWQRQIRKMRTENQQLRQERNAAREALALMVLQVVGK